ncbi:MAG TPA: 4Fe-4S dicluster domain-containing protein [Clostridia bacterium]|nr:4Fe-4S dicluster domain-containing protein [Clostridia bacterium]
MSKTWYPVIDYEKCIECGTCTDKCKHGVYDWKKAPTPVVIFPEGCVQGCHGCGILCPQGAISYVGDVTAKAENCGCSCEDEDS